MASVFCTAALAMTTLTGCEGSDIFGVNSPDWLSEKINDIANANTHHLPTTITTML